MSRLSAEEIAFYEPLVALYLQYGSVNKVFAKKQYDTGVSYPHFQRVLKEWGIVKSAGPQSHLTQAIFFLTRLARNNLPLETLYKTMPHSLQVSTVTLHRILSHIKKRLTRRHGTALVISPKYDSSVILIGEETQSRPEVGKPIGALSLPMTYSKKREGSASSILRVIQQEVASSLTLKRQLPTSLALYQPRKVLTINIADIHVQTYRLTLPNHMLDKLDSYKLKNLRFIPLTEIAQNVGLDNNYRAGVPEIAANLLWSSTIPREIPPHLNCYLNQELATIPAFV